MIVTLHDTGMVSVSDHYGELYANSKEDSLDLLEWFTGVRSENVFENSSVFNNDGRMVRLVKE